MRKAQKRQLLEFTESFYQAHGEIDKALEQKNRTLAQNMIRECQKFAIELGHIIENFEGEGHTTVSYLEEYCETLFQTFRELESEEVNRQKLVSFLREQLLKVENSIRHDICVKKEVVFLPYKASMWDSLESIWKTASEDEDYEAYVMPIPYFDRNADGTLGQMYYEGNQFPVDVPIISWMDYSMEENRPDMIFIHNPYDDCNYVTSIHPDFYARNLKKYTDMLIYVPYFVMAEIGPEDKAEVEKISHLCFAPGIIQADRVIVQSEGIRQIYINEYSKAAKKTGLPPEHYDRKKLGKKILGLGSPKIDRVMNLRREDMEIPEKWLEKIHKSDGSRKKVLLYNTGIAALLQYDEKWVQKIENVLAVMEGAQDEITLLWRPHPLIESTMRSMRPELLQRYLAIKNRYLADDWGIYDDTADVDRAVVLSDAYYGDPSSVIELCRCRGMVVMMQEPEVLG